MFCLKANTFSLFFSLLQYSAILKNNWLFNIFIISVCTMYVTAHLGQKGIAIDLNKERERESMRESIHLNFPILLH